MEPDARTVSAIVDGINPGGVAALPLRRSGDGLGTRPQVGSKQFVNGF